MNISGKLPLTSLSEFNKENFLYCSHDIKSTDRRVFSISGIL